MYDAKSADPRVRALCWYQLLFGYGTTEVVPFQIADYAFAATAPVRRSFRISWPRENSSSSDSLPASTSARIAFCARYSLFTTPALDCSMRHALRRSTQNMTNWR